MDITARIEREQILAPDRRVPQASLMSAKHQDSGRERVLARHKQVATTEVSVTSARRLRPVCIRCGDSMFRQSCLADYLYTYYTR